MSSNWTAADIPDQTGRTAVVTGANSGLGLETARELARHGATVVLACRDTAKGERALQEIQSSAPAAELELAGPGPRRASDSVKGFAEHLAERGTGIDLLINNAGVMAPPRRLTSDGFELQMGTNVLGHFALTGRLHRPDAGARRTPAW